MLQQCGTTGAIIYADGKVNQYNYLGKFSVSTEHTYILLPSSFILNDKPKNRSFICIPKAYTKNVHKIIIFNIKKLGVIQMSINNKIDKYDMVFSYNRIPCNIKKE